MAQSALEVNSWFIAVKETEEGGENQCRDIQELGEGSKETQKGE